MKKERLKYIYAVVSVILLTALDQLTKQLAVVYLKPIVSKPLIPGVFELYYTTNPGAAFGILKGFRWFFLAVTLIVLCVLTYCFIKLPKTKAFNAIRVCLVFIAAGGIGNGVDRAIHGEVVDFFYFSLIDFPIFNVADMYNVCGSIVLFVIYAFFVKSVKSQ